MSIWHLSDERYPSIHISQSSRKNMALIEHEKIGSTTSHEMSLITWIIHFLHFSCIIKSWHLPFSSLFTPSHPLNARRAGISCISWTLVSSSSLSKAEARWYSSMIIAIASIDLWSDSQNYLFLYQHWQLVFFFFSQTAYTQFHIDNC